MPRDRAHMSGDDRDPLGTVIVNVISFVLAMIHYGVEQIVYRWKRQSRFTKTGLILSALFIILILSACSRMDRATFMVVGNNVDSPEAVTIYIAGKEQGEAISIGVPVLYEVEIPVARRNNTATGPDYRRQCFPISGRAGSKATRSESNCMREDQIAQADFRLNRGLLELTVRVR